MDYKTMNDSTKDDDYAPVNGAHIASQILSHIPAGQRDILLQRIGEKSPDALGKINEYLLSFEDLIQASPRGMQRLVREIDHDDLLLALRHTSNELKAFFIRNMSERKARTVIQDLHTMQKRPLAEIEAAQDRILQRVDELRTAGLFQMHDESDTWVP